MNPQLAAEQVAKDLQLLPCPFCGKSAKLLHDSDQDMQCRIPKYAVACESCGAHGPSFSEYNVPTHRAILNAKSAWNVRDR